MSPRDYHVRVYNISSQQLIISPDGPKHSQTEISPVRLCRNLSRSTCIKVRHSENNHVDNGKPFHSATIHRCMLNIASKQCIHHSFIHPPMASLKSLTNLVHDLRKNGWQEQGCLDKLHDTSWASRTTNNDHPDYIILVSLSRRNNPTPRIVTPISKGRDC